MSRLFRTAANVAVASAVHGRVRQRQHDRWAASNAQAQAAQAQASQAQPSAPAAPPAPAAAPAPAAPAAGVNDVLAQLTQLGQLRDAGVLTDAEFETQKARILAA